MGGDFEKYEGNLKGMNRMCQVDGIDVCRLFYRYMPKETFQWVFR